MFLSVDFSRVRLDLDAALQALRDGANPTEVEERLAQLSKQAHQAFRRAARRLSYIDWPEYPRAMKKLATACLRVIEAEYEVAEITNALARRAKQDPGRWVTDEAMAEDEKRPAGDAG